MFRRVLAGILVLYVLVVMASVSTSRPIHYSRAQYIMSGLPRHHWELLPGGWILTWYGSPEDGMLGRRHGAAWHGLTCYYPGSVYPMPDVVTSNDMGGAMPGTQYYCKPVLVCIAGRPCVLFVAVDVPGRYVVYGKQHIDVWPAVARQLGLLEMGVYYGDVSVYVGSR